MDAERQVELKETIAAMTKLSKGAYKQAFSANMGTRCHAFLEFCGLMNEFINMCRCSLADGIDFAHANVHSGQHLQFSDHHVLYLREKLTCIYGKDVVARLAELEEIL